MPGDPDLVRTDVSVRATIYDIGEEPAEAFYWRDVHMHERIEATEDLRRQHHGWELRHDPGLERIARLVEFA